ncbi:hypothetical protein [Amycolatopsis samaneae]|uniref:Uncharacterized protein n=1 Tax=Amycolatopsis samaneae TaxID=664691 RepID=A0ABW5GM79_9PSEU
MSFPLSPALTCAASVLVLAGTVAMRHRLASVVRVVLLVVSIVVLTAAVVVLVASTPVGGALFDIFWPAVT